MSIEQIKYKLVNLADVEQALDKTKPLMMDTETIGFYGKIRLVQFYQRHFKEVLIVENPNTMELVSLLNNIVTVCHNIAYDISTIQENIGKMSWMPNEFHCTFLLSRLHFYKEEAFSLDKVIKYTLGYDPYNGNDQQLSDWSVPVLSEQQLEYAAMDVFYLHDVWDICQPMLEDYSYRLDILTTRYCMDFQNNGMPVEEDKVKDFYADNMRQIQEIGLPINCNSPKQTRAYINSMLSDDLGLARLIAQGDDKANAVRKTRKLTKSNSFLKKYLDTMIDGVIYGKFKCSPRSGRLACDNQNLQQLPRPHKKVFGVPQNGDTVIIFSDFSQMQLRGVCAVTGDTAMETIFREGKDVHNYVAEMTFGEAFTKEQRQIAKTENFGLLFGAGITVFGAILLKEAGIWLSEIELGNLRTKWLRLWKQVKDWQTKGIKDWKNGIPWATPLGRRYTAKMMTDQLNIQIQGFEAEVAKLALHYMIPKLKPLHTSIKLRNFIHDSYIFTCINDVEIYKQACKIIADCMQEAWNEMSKGVAIQNLPMPVKVQVGFNWGEIENGKFIYELKQDSNYNDKLKVA